MKIENVDPAGFMFAPLKRLTNSTLSNIVYGGSVLDVMLPELVAPFPVDDRYNTVRLNLDPDAVMTEKLRAFEAHVLDRACANFWDWFGQRQPPTPEETLETVKAMFKSSVVTDGSGKYLSMKLKATPETTYWTSDRELATKDIVTPQSVVQTVMRPAYLYFTSEKGKVTQFGVTYLMRQCMLVGVAEKQSDTNVCMF